MKFCVFPNDPLLAYFEKGEIKEKYFNPCNFFDEVHVISLFDDEISETKIKHIAGNAKFKIHKLGKANLKNYKNFEQKILQIIKEINPDIIRAYNPLVQGWLACKTAKKLNIPVVISLHTNYKQQKEVTKQKRKLFQYIKLAYATKNLERPVLGNADAVICVYDFIVSYAKDMGAKNIFVIYNKIDLKKFSPICTKEFDSSRPTILSVGRLIDQKEHSLIIKSIVDLDVDLLIIGDGPNYKKLNDLVKQLKIQDKVRFIKRVPNEDLNKFYVSCRIYAQPMVNLGGIPMPVLEAMASGLPIVMSKKEGTEIIDEVILSVDNDPKEFQNAFKKILESKDLESELSRKGLKKINEINSDKMEEKEVALYKKLIKKYELKNNSK